MATFKLIASPLFPTPPATLLSFLFPSRGPLHPSSLHGPLQSKTIPDSFFSLIVGAPPSLASQTQKRAELVLHLPTPLPWSKALVCTSIRAQFLGGEGLQCPSSSHPHGSQTEFSKMQNDHITPLFLKSLVPLIILYHQVKTPLPGI